MKQIPHRICWNLPHLLYWMDFERSVATIRSLLIGTGSYVPDFVLTNDILEELVDTNDEWIVKRTGIRERRIGPGMTTWQMGVEAGRKALQSAKMPPEEIDMLILSTCTPDTYSPTVSGYVQEALGLKKAAAVDINACCTGFCYASDIADCYIKAGKAKTILVVSAETLHRITDYTDRGTCVLFGDAAGAAVYRACEDENEQSGILSSFMAADGSGADYLYMEALPVEEDPLHSDRKFSEKNRFLKMQGAAVVRFTASAVPHAIDMALQRAGLTAADVDWVVPHQANLRILQIIAQKFGIPNEKIYVNMDRYGNTSSASIPLCLDEMNDKGLLKKGQVIVCTGFGGGLTYGAFVLRL